jgi:hypothetical protein
MPSAVEHATRRAFQQSSTQTTGDLRTTPLLIGETYYAVDDTNAVRHYSRVERFSDQNKAPDALFKIALARTGDPPRAPHPAAVIEYRAPPAPRKRVQRSGSEAVELLSR